MGTEENGDSLFAGQILNHLVDILRTFRIKAGSRLVKKKELWADAAMPVPERVSVSYR